MTTPEGTDPGDVPPDPSSDTNTRGGASEPASPGADDATPPAGEPFVWADEAAAVAATPVDPVWAAPAGDPTAASASADPAAAPDGGAPPPGAAPPWAGGAAGAAGPPPPTRTLTDPRYLVALGGFAAAVLVIGAVALARTGGSESISGSTASTAAATTTVTTVATTQAPTTPAPTTTSTTSTTSTSSTTSTTAVPPPLAVADADGDLAVDGASDVTLVARNLSDENQSVVWRQTAGPDVTDGRGRLIGAEVGFRAPLRPTTVRFEVTVTGRGGDTATDTLRVDVFDDADDALFVDADRGDDGAAGTRAAPFRTLARALEVSAGRGTDIYLRSLGDRAYDAGDGVLDGGSSLFGGYDDDWIRNAADPVRIATGPGGLTVRDSERTIVSAVEIDGASGEGLVAAMQVDGVERFVLEHADLAAADSVDGVSAGLVASGVEQMFVVDATIAAGDAGDGRRGDDAAVDAVTGGPGAPAVGLGGGPGGDAGADGAAGGDGGDGGEGLDAGDDGAPEGLGGAGGIEGVDLAHGRPGEGGPGGTGGSGGDGGSGVDLATTDAADLRARSGAAGGRGSDGIGGGGGGGGGGLVAHDGGGGGGGGGAGTGGAAGQGGLGGYVSVGMWLVDVGSVEIGDSTISGGRAGDGGAGGDGASGAAGGLGGDGAEGASTFLSSAGHGGGGGGGGAGGVGGDGGGGAGGASVGLLTFRVGSAVVDQTSIVGGSGGDGGAGGRGGGSGLAGTPGTERAGGGGGTGVGEPRGDDGTPARGGDSIGWWDDGGTRRTLTESAVSGGVGGRPGGDGGEPGASVDTRF